MKKLYAILLLTLGIGVSVLTAQTRYLEPVFSGVQVTNTVPYGVNTTVLAFPTFIKQPLIMDVYTPASDTETKRPVVLYLHTGNFLPFKSPIDGSLGFNGSCGGTVKDSSVVEACTRLAKMGYVALAVDYRLGWNPLASSDVDRRYGIINAAYRGIQDVRTCIRFLKKSVKEAGNPFGIDSTRIVVWGQGTGGYLSMNAAVLDNYTKIPFASEGKFLWDHDQNAGTPPIPMIVPQVNGDINATSLGLLPNAMGKVDTLCFPNHLGYTSSFQLAVNMAGACADSAWIDPGQPPVISYHVPYDNFAPYAEGIVNVPGTNLQVVKVQGSYIFQQLMEKYGNNGSYTGKPTTMNGTRDAAFAATPIISGNDWTDPTPGLYPLNQQIVQTTPVILPKTTAPWEWSGVVPVNPTCNLDKQSALTYLDTVFNFYAPRACFALGLQSCVDKILGEKEPLAHNIDVLAAPNPASSQITFSTDKEILSLQVFDRMGRMIREIPNVNNNVYQLQNTGFSTGLYVVKLSFKEGFVSKVIQFN